MIKQDNREGRIQFVFVSVEGSQETLQETLRQVGGALNRGISSQPKTIMMMPPQNSSGNNPGGNGDENPLGVQIGLPYESPDLGENGFSPINIKPKRERKAPPTPSLLKDFDPNDAEVSFERYISGKNATTQINKYLLIGAWFKKYKETEEIGPSHIYTLFQLMKWSAPDDMGQPFRDMKKKNSYFGNGSKKNLWAITIVGLNEVDRMKPTGDVED